jgi:hypothetical protein
MSQNAEPAIMRCVTCGRYIYAEDAFKGRFCSQPCSFSYRRCTVCGRYFRRGPRSDRCSGDCAVNYRLQRRPTRAPTVEIVEEQVTESPALEEEAPAAAG